MTDVRGLKRNKYNKDKIDRGRGERKEEKKERKKERRGKQEGRGGKKRENDIKALNRS